MIPTLVLIVFHLAACATFGAAVRHTIDADPHSPRGLAMRCGLTYC